MGRPEWAYGLDEAMFKNFYSLDKKSILAWESAHEIYIQRRRVPADLLPIAHDAGAFVAGSFTDFLKSLRPMPGD
jgi:hypothetical protein